MPAKPKRSAGPRAAADRELQQRIVPQPVVVVAVLVAAGDGRGPRHHQLEHRVANAALVTVVGHRIGDPPAHAELPLGLANEQQPGVGRLLAALEIDCELLAPDGCQVELERDILHHGGCGAGLIREARRLDSEMLRESRHLHHNRQRFSQVWCIIRARLIEAGLSPTEAARQVGLGRARLQAEEPVLEQDMTTLQSSLPMPQAERSSHYQRTAVLDQFRACAVLLVVVYHTVQMSPVPLPSLARVTWYGQHGVDLFFCPQWLAYWRALLART